MHMYLYLSIYVSICLYPSLSIYIYLSVCLFLSYETSFSFAGSSFGAAPSVWQSSVQRVTSLGPWACNARRFCARHFPTICGRKGYAV